MAFLGRSRRRAAWSGDTKVGRGAHLAAPDGIAFGPAGAFWRFAPRIVVSICVLALFLWLLSDRIARLDTAALTAAVLQLSALQWAKAAAFTALSFWAVGRYDAVLHQHLMTGVPARLARRAGIAAIAVSQTLGLGLVSGAIVRWRMLPGVSLWQATRLTAAVAMSFLAGWVVVTCLALLVLPAAPFKPMAALGLAVALGLGALSILGPWADRLPFRWPNGLILSRLVGLCAVDTIAAAMAFYALLPLDSGIALHLLIPAFLLALGAGLALGTPGGMGAFEVTLLALLPGAAEPQVLVAILGWRLIYYVLPALAGAGLALAGPRPSAAQPRLQTRPFGVAELADLPAEVGLRHQGSLALARFGGAAWLIGRRGHVLVALLDPAPMWSPHVIDTALRGLRRHARAEGRSFAAYKTGPRTAARGRAMGFAVRRIGWEAWVDPSRYRLSSSCRSGLRRKLRRAEAAGVTLHRVDPDGMPWRALDGLAADWTLAHGDERGFSMGRHDRAYLAQQKVYVACLQGEPIAYASFHTCPQEWTLDLMRHRAALPDGTMHALIQAAIEDAAALGLSRLSLASVPGGAFGPGDRVTRLVAALAPETAAPGLLQFKACFGPRWAPRYLIAPGRFGLVLAGLSLWHAIIRPPPVPREIDEDHAEYGFASRPGPWHIQRQTD